jgi:transposase-like protein
MKCTKCQSEHHIKNEIIKGRQRYKRKDCGNNFTLDILKLLKKRKKAI